MRLRLRWWRELFFLGALLFSLIALLPLRLALDGLGFADKGLTAREAEGASGSARSTTPVSARSRSATSRPGCGRCRCSPAGRGST